MDEYGLSREGRPIMKPKTASGTNEYRNIHYWLRTQYGKPKHCQNINCKGLSNRYEWALRKGCNHERNRSSYLRLCYKCHLLYDNRDNYLKTVSRVKVNQLTLDGKIIKTWCSVTEATQGVGGKAKSSISIAMNSPNRTAYGYRWEHA